MSQERDQLGYEDLESGSQTGGLAPPVNSGEMLQTIIEADCEGLELAESEDSCPLNDGSTLNIEHAGWKHVFGVLNQNLLTEYSRKAGLS